MTKIAAAYSGEDHPARQLRDGLDADITAVWLAMKPWAASPAVESSGNLSCAFMRNDVCNTSSKSCSLYSALAANRGGVNDTSNLTANAKGISFPRVHRATARGGRCAARGVRAYDTS